MNETIIVGLIACVGTMCGSLFGVVASAKLTGFRLEQLEKKVEKHNNLVERMAKVEQSCASAHHRIDEIRGELDAVERHAE